MLSLIITATLFAASNGQYCSTNYCTICPNHTLCKYPTSEFGQLCGTTIYAELTCASEQQDILDAHNDRRRQVAYGNENRGKPGPQPPAANMRKLVWDDELAGIAQHWTNQCNTSSPLCSDVASFKVAENHFAAANSPPNPDEPQNWVDAVDHWYAWVEEFNSSQVSPYVAGPAEMYTKIVWADTYKIGCGFTGFTRSDGYYIRYYLCLYGPGGNVVAANSNVYKIGPACSACPDGTACDDGLCV